MKSIILKEKTGFYSDSPVHILDYRKNLFYFHPNKEGKINFNLPEGKFFIIGKTFEKLNSPIFYEKIPLPITNRIPFVDKVSVKNNPNKATIYTRKRKIELDKSIVNHWFNPVFVFVVGHEFGHNFFKSEELCDKYSFNNMLYLGYNPIQIYAAQKMLLKENLQRCQHFDNSIFNLKNLRK